MNKKLTLFPIIGLTVLVGWTAPVKAESKPVPTVTIMTLNLHNCRDQEQRSNLNRLAGLVAAHQPDILVLQEVQPYSLKKAPIQGYRQLNGPNANLAMIHFGNVVLTRHPVYYYRHHYLPSRKEQRGLDEVALKINGQTVWVLGTHLGLGRQEQAAQFAALQRITGYFPGPLLIAGDFNIEPANPLFYSFTFAEALSELNPGSKTYPAWHPTVQADQIRYSRHFKPIEAKTIAWQGSDHLPVLASLALVDDTAYPPDKPEIPDPSRSSNPLLPEPGEHPSRLELAWSQQGAANASPDLDGSITLPIRHAFEFQAGYREHQAEMRVTGFIPFDLRDYFSLVGIRGKGEWGFALVSDVEDQVSFEWSQYYRWSDKWGTKVVWASGDLAPEWRWKQCYLPTENLRLTVGADADSGREAHLALALNPRQVVQIGYQKTDTQTRYQVGFEYRFQ